jgi:hypothetical protein
MLQTTHSFIVGNAPVECSTTIIVLQLELPDRES